VLHDNRKDASLLTEDRGMRRVGRSEIERPDELGKYQARPRPTRRLPNAVVRSPAKRTNGPPVVGVVWRLIIRFHLGKSSLRMPAVGFEEVAFGI
jgi:hypothetical protein